ncbi:hypothetical protein [Pseudoalteromonas aurantia]|uniref:Uncharacterized protein n=1 Tax=Pseudoalteromonas aurantia 208 TaxID=1314867 RepID=A0ABR9EE03_9GAMM|nr:hypothetical protein [Pseudoalteromonas aurantia]MBE0369209.1 hypothetical protein [Pseudoalteromonas aurantia 208]
MKFPLNIGALCAVLAVLPSAAYTVKNDKSSYFMSQGKEVRLSIVTKNFGRDISRIAFGVECTNECHSSAFTYQLMEDYVRATLNDELYSYYYVEDDDACHPQSESCMPKELQEGDRAFSLSLMKKNGLNGNQASDEVISTTAQEIITQLKEPSKLPPFFMISEMHSLSSEQVIPKQVCRFNGLHCEPSSIWQFVYNGNDQVTVNYSVDKSSLPSIEDEYALQEFLAVMGYQCMATYKGKLPHLSGQKECYYRP